MSEILTAAVFDPDVIAHAREATVLERFDVAIDAVEYDSHVSNVRMVRELEPADYVAAIHAHIEKFDGLEAADVDEAAVAAVLPEPAEQEEVA